jgi:hypothetical protein
MDNECALCHSNSDGRNPFIGQSDGTANNPGLGCTGCHEPFGLRLHHVNNGQEFCASCHNDPAPPSEDTLPPYYGTVDTNANNPCNPVMQAEINENWSVGDFLGLDNDGDNLYDMDDPDCLQGGQTPGETAGPGLEQLRITGHDRDAGSVSFTFGVACQTNDNTLVYGALEAVSAYGYMGQACELGNSGSGSWEYPDGSLFFVLVGNNGEFEGSYGNASGNVERPSSPGGICLLPKGTDPCD